MLFNIEIGGEGGLLSSSSCLATGIFFQFYGKDSSVNSTVDIRVSTVSILGQLLLYTPLGRWAGVGISPILSLFYVNPFCFSTSTRRFKFGPNTATWGSGGGTFSAACVVIIVLLGQGMHSRSRAP